MPKYVAFLRAINVGGHTVKMDSLRQMFEAIGFANVSTFIASGNVIFDSKSKNTKALERKIEDYLQLTLAYSVATFLRSTSELAEIAGYRPFKDFDLNVKVPALYIGFISSDPSDESKKKIHSFTSKVDEFHVAGREVYWLCRTKFSDSNISSALLEKTLGMQATFRNSTTVRKIATII